MAITDLNRTTLLKTKTRTRGLCGLREFYHANFQQIPFEMHHIKHPEEKKCEN